MAHSNISFPVQTAVDCDLCEGHVKVDWYCITCHANLCEKCKVVHLSRKAFRKHEVTTRELYKKHQDHGDPGLTDKCHIHIRNNVIMMCVTCETPVCNKCILSTHNEHKFESLDAKLERSKENLSKYIQKLDQKDKCILDHLKKNDEVSNTVDGETQETKKEIIKARDAEIASIKLESDKLIEQLETRMKKNKNEVSTSNSKLNAFHDKIQDRIKNAKAKQEGQGSSAIDQFIKESEKSIDADTSFSITMSIPKFVIQNLKESPKIGTLHFEDRTIQRDPARLTSPVSIALQKEDRIVKNVPLHSPSPSNVKVIRTFTASIRATEIRAISSTQVWCNQFANKLLQLYNMNGRSINSLSLEFDVQGFVINDLGNFIVCDVGNNSIKQVTPDGSVSTLCSTSPQRPQGICLNHKRQPVVCMGESLVVYSSDCKTKLQNFTQDQHGQSLFVRSYRVAMNDMTYYCVVDIGDKRVVTINVEGTLRWTYSGRPEHKRFKPYNICCDRHNHVIVADTDNNKVHLLDSEGQFITCITDRLHIQDPRGLAVTDDNILWIGEDYSQKVHVIKYLK